MTTGVYKISALVYSPPGKIQYAPVLYVFPRDSDLNIAHKWSRILTDLARASKHPLQKERQNLMDSILNNFLSLLKIFSSKNGDGNIDAEISSWKNLICKNIGTPSEYIRIINSDIYAYPSVAFEAKEYDKVFEATAPKGDNIYDFYSLQSAVGQWIGVYRSEDNIVPTARLFIKLHLCKNEALPFHWVPKGQKAPLEGPKALIYDFLSFADWSEYTDTPLPCPVFPSEEEPKTHILYVRGANDPSLKKEFPPGKHTIIESSENVYGTMAIILSAREKIKEPTTVVFCNNGKLSQIMVDEKIPFVQIYYFCSKNDFGKEWGVIDAEECNRISSYFLCTF